MKLILCTIGFTGKTAEEFFQLLDQAGVRKVIDVRENRGGQLSGYAKFPDIVFFLQRIGGIAYEHEPLFAPALEIRKAYRASRDWPAYEAAFLELMRERGVPGRCEPSRFVGPVAFLCSEATAEKCHRRLVVELLAKHFDAGDDTVEIHHLVSGKPTQGKPTKLRLRRSKSPAR